MAGLAPQQSMAANPVNYSAAGGVSALNNLNQALNANQNAYQGLQNQAQQQYKQNAGAVQANLANAGLGNTTVAQTMAQAPLQTLNNALLNITGQQQGQAANLYGQQANVNQNTGNSIANLMMALNAQNLQQQAPFNQAQANVAATTELAPHPTNSPMGAAI
jgi:hypothetical protein